MTCAAFNDSVARTRCCVSATVQNTQAHTTSTLPTVPAVEDSQVQLSSPTGLARLLLM